MEESEIQVQNPIQNHTHTHKKNQKTPKKRKDAGVILVNSTYNSRRESRDRRGLKQKPERRRKGTMDFIPCTLIQNHKKILNYSLYPQLGLTEFTSKKKVKQMEKYSEGTTTKTKNAAQHA